MEDDFLWVSCRDGWKTIIRETDKKLKFIDPGYTVAQIKEKFGGLRYYYDQTVEYGSTASQIMEDIVRAAENAASRTCEICGANHPSAKVEVREYNGWYFGYCKSCTDEKTKER